MDLQELEAKLDQDIRPALRAHGGDVRVEGFENGVLRLSLLGACARCPAAEITAEKFIGEELKSAMPEIKSVSVRSGVSDELLAQARSMLSDAAKK